MHELLPTKNKEMPTVFDLEGGKQYVLDWLINNSVRKKELPAPTYFLFSTVKDGTTGILQITFDFLKGHEDGKQPAASLMNLYAAQHLPAFVILVLPTWIAVKPKPCTYKSWHKHIDDWLQEHTTFKHLPEAIECAALISQQIAQPESTVDYRIVHRNTTTIQGFAPLLETEFENTVTLPDMYLLARYSPLTGNL